MLRWRTDLKSVKRYLKWPEVRDFILVMRRDRGCQLLSGLFQSLTLLPVVVMLILAIALWFRIEEAHEILRGWGE